MFEILTNKQKIQLKKSPVNTYLHVKPYLLCREDFIDMFQGDGWLVKLLNSPLVTQ